MTASYRVIQWNTHKRVYDLCLVAMVTAYLLGFLSMSLAGDQPPDPMIAMIRATGTLALILLHLILLIGPVSRFTTRLAPVLYNRRHAGVTLFLIALAHAVLVTLYYGSWGVIDPVHALFGYNESGIAFEFFGFTTLLVLFIMAATSHDFWLANLGHRVWKAMHMMVYVAYGSVLLHVSLGALQDHRDPLFTVLIGAGAVLVVGIHLAAGFRERSRDRSFPKPEGDWIEIGPVDSLPLNRARVVGVSGEERIAVMRHKGGVSAVSNVCAHQGGPLGEGEVIDGCLTCPWHGHQYRPEDGRSPPPFKEKIPTYQVRVVKGCVQVRCEPNAPGTAVKPTAMGGESDAD